MNFNIGSGIQYFSDPYNDSISTTTTGTPELTGIPGTIQPSVNNSEQKRREIKKYGMRLSRLKMLIDGLDFLHAFCIAPA